MKKILLCLMLIFMTCGCSNEVFITFDEDTIDINGISEFTSKEYKNTMSIYSPEISEDISNDDLKDVIKDYSETLSIPAFIEGEGKEFTTKLTEDSKYKLTVDYSYNYDNFKDNYILNRCFTYFNFTEDKDTYYFKASGNYSCPYDNVKVVIAAPYRMLNNNSTSYEDDVYSWNIEDTNNDVYFAISKEEIKTSGISFLYIVAGIVIFILIGVILSFRQKYK